jgi:hypothetical protein
MTLDFCQLRDRCGLELADIASEFGEPLDSVYRWENGEVSPPDRVLRSLVIMADFSSGQHIPKVEARQSIAVLEHADVAARVEPITSRQRKSLLGQFMTPPSVADFMVSLFTLPKSGAMRLLDAGAGHGRLTTAFIERSLGSP